MNQIESIIARLERQRDAVDRALGALRDISGSPATLTKNLGSPLGKKRQMSAEGRARIGEATRRRWALKRVADAVGTIRPGRASKKAGGRRKMSAEGRANIVAAAKRMWAKKNAAKKTSSRI